MFEGEDRHLRRSEAMIYGARWGVAVSWLDLSALLGPGGKIYGDAENHSKSERKP